MKIFEFHQLLKNESKTITVTACTPHMHCNRKNPAESDKIKISEFLTEFNITKFKSAAEFFDLSSILDIGRQSDMR